MMSPYAMYFDQKLPKQPKQKTLPLNGLKQLFPVSDQILERSNVQFQRKPPKNLNFERKRPNFGQKRGPRMTQFFQNINFH